MSFLENGLHLKHTTSGLIVQLGRRLCFWTKMAQLSFSLFHFLLIGPDAAQARPAPDHRPLQHALSWSASVFTTHTHAPKPAPTQRGANVGNFLKISFRWWEETNIFCSSGASVLQNYIRVKTVVSGVQVKGV